MEKHLTFMAFVAALAGCTTMAPTYQRPDSPVAAGWPVGAPTAPAAAPDASAVQPPTLLEWQDFVVDPDLRRLVSLALANNRDVRVTALNIERTQAQYQISRASLFPQINANAGEASNLTPADLSPTGHRALIHEYTVGLGFSAYELDFFGRVRSLKDAALEQYLGTEQAYRSTQISLIAQVGAAYLTLLSDRGHLELARNTLLAQASMFELNQHRFKYGTISQLDLSQAQTAVDTARGDVARYTSVVAQDVNALALLVGAPIPQELLDAPGHAELPALRDVPAGLPSDLLYNRPDILEAEHQLKSAYANIGAARAAFFPTISLTGSFGFASAALSGLWGPSSHAWLFAPQLSIPIFDAGRSAANLKIARTDQSIYLAQYERAIQGAFREVADSLAVRATIDDQLAAQQSLVDATAMTFKLSSAQFKNGVSSYLVVLDSQRSLYAAQHNLLSLQLAQAINRVTLYKALGGGLVATAQTSMRE
jgi:multidrug efflux system outer membrane protein